MGVLEGEEWRAGSGLVVSLQVNIGRWIAAMTAFGCPGCAMLSNLSRSMFRLTRPYRGIVMFPGCTRESAEADQTGP